jgi:hypothetical protein
MYFSYTDIKITKEEEKAFDAICEEECRTAGGQVTFLVRQFVRNRTAAPDATVTNITNIAAPANDTSEEF